MSGKEINLIDFGKLGASSPLEVITKTSNGAFISGAEGVKTILTTPDKKVELIGFENKTLAYVPSAMQYDAYYPIHPVTLEKPVKAVLMDLDGTSVKSEEFWIWIIERSVASLLDNPKFQLEESDLPYVSGHSVTEHLAYCIEKYCPDKSLEKAREFYFMHTNNEMKAILEGRGRAGAFTPTDGLKDFLHTLKDKGIKIGLVTSGLYEKAMPEIISAFNTLGMGDSIYNPDSLTPLGKRQAEAVAKRLAQHGIDEIYSSPSNRALETATPLFEMLKKPITTLDWCNEHLAWEEFTVINKDGAKNWMFWDHKVREKFAEKAILDLRNDWYKDPFFDEKVGQGVNRVNTEVDNFIKALGYNHDRERGVYKVEKHNEKRIAIFAHQGFSMIFFSSLLDIPYPLFSTRFDISHSCVSAIHFPISSRSEIIPKILQYSNDSHIYKESLPTKYNNGMHI